MSRKIVNIQALRGVAALMVLLPHLKNYDLRFGGNHGLTVEGRYTWGLADIKDLSAGVKQQTRTFLVLAGVSF